MCTETFWSPCTTSLTVLVHFYTFCFVENLRSKFHKNNPSRPFSSVCWCVLISDHPSYTVLPPKASAAQRFKTSEPFDRQEWNHQGSRLWSGSGIWSTCKSLHSWGLWLNKLHYIFYLMFIPCIARLHIQNQRCALGHINLFVNMRLLHVSATMCHLQGAS
jgi:hypothetical protein